MTEAETDEETDGDEETGNDKEKGDGHWARPWEADKLPREAACIRKPLLQGISCLESLCLDVLFCMGVCLCVCISDSLEVRFSRRCLSNCIHARCHCCFCCYCGSSPLGTNGATKPMQRQHTSEGATSLTNFILVNVCYPVCVPEGRSLWHLPASRVSPFVCPSADASVSRLFFSSPSLSSSLC